MHVHPTQPGKASSSHEAALVGCCFGGGVGGSCFLGVEEDQVKASRLLLRELLLPLPGVAAGDDRPWLLEAMYGPGGSVFVFLLDLLAGEPLLPPRFARAASNPSA